MLCRYMYVVECRSIGGIKYLKVIPDFFYQTYLVYSIVSLGSLPTLLIINRGGGDRPLIATWLILQELRQIYMRQTVRQFGNFHTVR